MTQENSSFKIGKRAFMASVLILFILMIFVYALTYILPSGSYERQLIDGQERIISGTYTEVTGGITFVKWLLSPVLVVLSEGGATIIAIILFLLVIGGTFNTLDNSGLLSYMLSKISHRFQHRRYLLLCLVALFFMSLGALVGSFEECVPLVPIVIALSCTMGWDAFMGMGMSLLAVGCGFATGIMNPFTVGVAQELAGVPMFSGMGFRILSFVAIYLILIGFLVLYGRRLEKRGQASPQELTTDFERKENKEKGLRLFGIILAAGIFIIICSTFIEFLQNIIMPLTALVFLVGGLVSVPASGVQMKIYWQNFKRGVIEVLPAAVLILLASSIRYILTEGKIMDTILYKSVELIEKNPQGSTILLIYLLVLIMNFFISSGSAKAFLLMPLITPLADLAGISRQLSILAFIYGDGFSNILYPTNPVLLISLGLSGISYGKWVRFTYKFQLIVLVVTCALLLMAQSLGY